MAVINEEITASTQSAEVTPTKDTTDVLVETNSTGQIFLQGKVPGGNWENITDQRGWFAVPTPDADITYRFAAHGISEATRVYFGAV